MVIDISNRSGKTRLQTIARSGVVGAVYKHGRIIRRVIDYRIRPMKLHSRHQKLQTPRNRIAVHANHVAAKRLEDSCESDLCSNTVTVRPRVTNDGNFTSGKSLQEFAKAN